jgi:alkanesulfonate monooxygenase SsuD/methylene tetrahydromethanopterin reductase-like flavin-dependent oxidoreductase (luciferase family)
MQEADARFSEALEILLRAWTSNERFSFHGKYWRFSDIVVEPPSAQKPHPQIWMGAGSERSIRSVAERGFNLLLGQYAPPEDVAQSIAWFRTAVEAQGRRYDPMCVGVTRAFFVTDSAAECDPALERRLHNRLRQLKLATQPDGTVLGGPTAPPALRTRSTSTAQCTALRTRSPAGWKHCARPGSATC